MKYMVLSWDKTDDEELFDDLQAKNLKVVEGIYDSLDEATYNYVKVKNKISNADLVKIIDMEEHI